MTGSAVGASTTTRGAGVRLRAAAATAGAAVMGVAPHVLHHAGPLAGAALLAGATGTALFGVLGFLLAVPILQRLHRRSGSWAAPAGLLAVMAVGFTLSTLLLGPAITGTGEQSNSASGGVPPGSERPGHEAHHAE